MFYTFIKTSAILKSTSASISTDSYFKKVSSGWTFSSTIKQWLVGRSLFNMDDTILFKVFWK